MTILFGGDVTRSELVLITLKVYWVKERILWNNPQSGINENIYFEMTFSLPLPSSKVTCNFAEMRTSKNDSSNA